MNNQFGVGLFFVILIIIVQSIIGSYISSKKFKYFHESEVAILLGIILSAIAYFGFNYTATLDKSFFIFIFLPAIIFSEGYSMKNRHFFHNIPQILTYGLLGTIITFFTITLLLNVINNHEMIKISVQSQIDGENGVDGEYEYEHIVLGMKDLTLLSAALCSKDSFLASTMVDHHSYPFLFHIIFGEGIINDVTSLILFESFEEFAESEVEKLEWKIIPKILWIMFKSISISIVAGVLSGIICSLILKHFQFLNKTVVHEILIIFMCSYGSYCIIESFHLSGVLSLLFSGFVIGHYAFYNLSDKGKLCSNVTFQTLSSGAENFLFAYLGFTTFSFYKNAWSLELIGFLILFLVIARFISVFVVTFILRFFLRGAFAVNLREQLVLYLTGMSRGILSYILVGSVEFEEHSDVINSTVLGVLIITTLFFGLVNPKLIDLLLPQSEHHQNSQNNIISNNNQSEDINDAHKINLEESHEEQIDFNENMQRKKLRTALLHQEYNKKNFPSKLSYKIQRLNAKYIKPFLIRNYYENFDEIVISKELFKEDKYEIMRPDEYNKSQFLIHQSIQNIANTLKNQKIPKFQIDSSQQNNLDIIVEVQKEESEGTEDKYNYDEDAYLDKINELELIKHSINKERYE